jgi:hypothetical protein
MLTPTTNPIIDPEDLARDLEPIAPVDREALTRSLWLAKRDKMRAQQLDQIELERGRRIAAEIASEIMQEKTLALEPWQEPLSHIDLATAAPNDPGAILLRQLPAAGLSRYEPDPNKALEQVERRHAARAADEA